MLYILGVVLSALATLAAIGFVIEHWLYFLLFVGVVGGSVVVTQAVEDRRSRIKRERRG